MRKDASDRGSFSNLGFQSHGAIECGDGVFEVGRADLILGDGQKATVKYVVMWKQEDGDWKWDVDIWNMNE